MWVPLRLESSPHVITQTLSPWEQEVGGWGGGQGHPEDFHAGDEHVPWWQTGGLSEATWAAPPDPGLTLPGTQARGCLPMPGSAPWG